MSVFYEKVVNSTSRRFVCQASFGIRDGRGYIRIPELFDEIIVTPEHGVELTVEQVAGNQQALMRIRLDREEQPASASMPMGKSGPNEPGVLV